MAMKSIQDWIQEIMAKNQTQQELPKAEEAFPTTDYVGQAGTRPEITTVPTDVELKATYSPMSALGVGIGHILKNLQQVRALNEQQSVKDYEAKIKAAQDKEAKQAEAQTQAKMLGYREQLPSSQAELKSRGIVDVGNLQKIQQNEEMFPLDIEAKRAQINRINQLAKQIGAPVAGKPPTAAQIKEKDRSEFGRIMNENKDIMGNYPSIPEAEKDIATKAILADPTLLQNELIRKAAGFYTKEDKLNYEEEKEMRRIQGQIKGAEGTTEPKQPTTLNQKAGKENKSINIPKVVRDKDIMGLIR